MCLLAGMLFPLTAAADESKRGDLNNDGGVDIADVISLIHYVINGEEHEWVDLGLPSCTLWATCNIGANAPEEYGDYFAWGETDPKDYYDWSTYKWCNGDYDKLTKYCTYSSYGDNGFTDRKTELDPEDDAAYVNWGSSWRMPTTEQQRELCEKCTCDWTTRYGVNGYLFTGPNGNTLFLPAAGSRESESLYNAGSWGSYWSRTLNSVYPEEAYFINFHLDNWGSWFHYARYYGLTVRSVCVSPSKRGDLNNDGSVDIADVVSLIYYVLNGEWLGETQHEWVDLGLPSGTLWATCNVGAYAPDEYGDYFAWGETVPKDYYDWSTYKWGNFDQLTKYCTDSNYGNNGFVDDKTELDPEDDAAYVNWGSSWRMPTTEQQRELCEKCTCDWTTRYGVNGYLFTGPNGNTLFLPAAGSRSLEWFSGAGSWGYYWSRTLDTSRNYCACHIRFRSGYVLCGELIGRYSGYSVRAVRVSHN